MSAGSTSDAGSDEVGPGSGADIPVLVDDVKVLGEFRMTRCTFYGIEASAAVHDWVADLRERGVPFLLFGLSAALHRPVGEARRFGSPEQVDRLFATIEDTQVLLVETEHLWIPNFLFAEVAKRSPGRGDVYRVSEDLFRKALQFQREVISAERFAEQCREAMASKVTLLQASPEESEVFRAWSGAQLEQARDNYQVQKADPERGVLSWLDEEGQVHAG